MRHFGLVIALLAVACGGGDGDPADLATPADLTGGDQASPPTDLATGGDLAMGALLCTKYGPPMLPPFVGAQFGVDYRPNLADAPAPTGGAIADGTYVVTSNTDYGYGNSNGTPDFRVLLILEQGAWFYRIEFSGADDMLYSGGRYTVDAAAKTIVFGTRLCGPGGQPASDPMKYSATSTTLKTYLDQPSGTTPPTIKEIVYVKQ